jgi:alanine racemase
MEYREIQITLLGVFVDGKRAPLLGRVSMDQFVVDLGKE